MVYTKSGTGTNSTLESAGFGGGRIFSTPTGVLSAHYQITDHLGSVRVAFTDKHTMLSQNDYYAYGKRHVNSRLSTTTDDSNRYLFNGKEAQTTGELGLLDFDTRMYSPEFIRFGNMDILIEEFPHQSPFVYADNNPVRFIDFMGMSAENPDSLGGHVPIPAIVITNEPSEYDPPTYNGGTIDDVIVLGTPIGQQVMEPIEGFGNHLWRFLWVVENIKQMVVQLIG